MSQVKKQIRASFRDAVFSRDGNQCRLCKSRKGLDAHHITSRDDMPNGGYVPENGISLCGVCHLKAEEALQTRTGHDRYFPGNLYRLIGSSYQKAWTASEELAC